MSFEVTARDLSDLFQLAWKVVNSCRQACGEQELLTREVASLYIVVSQLQDEAEKPNSSLHWQDDISRDELDSTIYGCRKLLRALDQVLAKHASSRRRGGARRGRFQKVQIKFGNGEVMSMRDVLEDLSTHKAALSLNLRLLTPSSRGSVEWPLGKQFPGMQQSLHWMMAKISSSHDGSNLSSSYSDDEKTVWKEIRRGLVRDGWSRRDVKKHRKAIKEYVKNVGWSDTFDDTPPSSNPSLHREPQDHYPRQPYTSDSFSQENFSQDSLPPQNYAPPPPPPPPNFISQQFSQQEFSQQGYPPPPPSNFPSQAFPQQNFAQQNFSQPMFHGQNFPEQDFPQHNYPPPPPPPPANFPPEHEGAPQQIFVIRNSSQESHQSESGRYESSEPVPSPQYMPPSVSDEGQEYDEKSEFIPPPQPQSQFSVRPCDLSDTFLQCTDKDTWNDMMESLVTTLIDTTKTVYFSCSICKKLITTAQARLDRSQNWCRNCFHAIVYNVLYYPLVPPEWCKLRPISQRRMQDIVKPEMKGLWASQYEELRAMRGRPAGRMLEPSLEEPPLLLYRNPAVQDEMSGRTLRTGYFEITYFEEPFSSFVSRRK
ncbi:hypothetical protein N431DRAFT_375922 [Stipitochalara longipes BDJ]|nr:hypothetical protein N431DRAFT_375922 [Stipitochalara longipes BDJ]